MDPTELPLKQEPRLEGWLKIQPEQGIKILWRKRWFIHRPEKHGLEYYLSDTDPILQGFIDLEKAQRIDKVINETLYFDIATDEKTYHLAALTQEEFDHWFDFLLVLRNKYFTNRKREARTPRFRYTEADDTEEEESSTNNFGTFVVTTAKKDPPPPENFDTFVVNTKKEVKKEKTTSTLTNPFATFITHLEGDKGGGGEEEKKAKAERPTSPVEKEGFTSGVAPPRRPRRHDAQAQSEPLLHGGREKKENPLPKSNSILGGLFQGIVGFQHHQEPQEPQQQPQQPAKSGLIHELRQQQELRSPSPTSPLSRPNEEREEGDRESGMSFREPEDWEKALVGLEAGKWTGEMESKVFRRFCKKGKKNVEELTFDEETTPKRSRRSRSIGDFPATFSAEIAELRIFMNLLNEKNGSPSLREQDASSASSPSLSNPSSASSSAPSSSSSSLFSPSSSSSSSPSTPSPSLGSYAGPSTRPLMPQTNKRGSVRPTEDEVWELQYPFALPPDSDALAILRHYQMLRKQHLELLEKHFFYRCVQIKSDRLRRGRPCNVPIALLVEAGLHVPIGQWESWINTQMDGFDAFMGGKKSEE